MALPSDTLFAALIDGWRRLGGDPAAWLAPFLGDPPDPPFALTSAFPFVGGVRFYPMPVDLRRLFAQAEAGKRVKRIAYLSEGLLRRAERRETRRLAAAGGRSEPKRREPATGGRPVFAGGQALAGRRRRAGEAAGMDARRPPEQTSATARRLSAVGGLEGRAHPASPSTASPRRRRSSTSARCVSPRRAGCGSACTGDDRSRASRGPRRLTQRV